MAWIAVDENGKAWIYTEKPVRNKVDKFWYGDNPALAIEKASCIHLIGRFPSWADEPVEIGEIKPEQPEFKAVEVDERAEFWKACVAAAISSPKEINDVFEIADAALDEHDKRFTNPKTIIERI